LTVTKLKFVPFCHSRLIWTDTSELQPLTMTVLSVRRNRTLSAENSKIDRLARKCQPTSADPMKA